MHPAKTSNVDGGVKNHSSSLDCCIDNLSSLQQTETTTHGGEQTGKARMALNFVDLADPTKYQDMGTGCILTRSGFFSHGRRSDTLLLPEEKEPTCCVQQKSYITMVRFLCAIVRPHFKPCVNCWWDGKLGNLAYR